MKKENIKSDRDGNMVFSYGTTIEHSALKKL
jgi:hypothetical protein